MRELTAEEQDILLKGSAANALLSNDAAASAINELNEGIVNSLLNTSLNETEKRDRMYYLHTALKELVAILKNRVNQAEALKASLEDESENN